MASRLAQFLRGFAPVENGRKQISQPEPVGAILLPRTKRDYSRDIGDGLGSSVIMAPVSYIATQGIQARPMIWEREPDSMKRTPRPDHDVLRVLNKPNPFYGGKTLWRSLLLSFCTAGNGYWLKARSRIGIVEQLWYVPHWTITPKWPRSGNTYIDHYHYDPEGHPDKGPFDGPFDSTLPQHGERIAPEDVCHFRNGVNPRNTRLGLSPLDPAIREVFTDEEASNFTATMLRNMGVPGIVISPAESGLEIPEGKLDEIKELFIQRFTGDRRGEPMVHSVPLKLEKVGFSPQELEVGNIRDIAEERVCALLHIPAAVVQFGTGLQQTKVGATMRELRRMAWTDGIIPKQLQLAETIQNDLVPEFEPEPDRFEFGFEFSGVEALQETEQEKSARIKDLVRDGIITVAAGQSALGFEPDPSQNVYLRRANTVERPAEDEDFEMPQLPGTVRLVEDA